MDGRLVEGHDEAKWVLSVSVRWLFLRQADDRDRVPVVADVSSHGLKL